MRNYLLKDLLVDLLGSFGVLRDLLLKNGIINPEVDVSAPVLFLHNQRLVGDGPFIGVSYFVNV